MILFFKYGFVYFIRFLLGLRYRIDFRGLDRIKADTGILFLPNHPGELDPVILMSRLWPRFRPRPVAVEDFFFMPGVNLLMRLVQAIPIPNVGLGGSNFQRRRVEQALDTVSGVLANRGNALIYPSGRMMRSPQEELRGASAAYDLLQRQPETRVVLARTRGLLGSSFAWYTHKARPNLPWAIRHGILWTLVNLILFNPRRRVTVEFVDVTDDLPKEADKVTLNRWLEDWYNQPGPEEPTQVSYCRWWPVTIAIKEYERRVRNPDVKIPDAIRDRVIKELARIADADSGAIQADQSLSGDLGLDSLNTADLVTWLAEEFQVMDVDAEELSTVQDVLAAAVGAIGNLDDTGECAPAPAAWQDSLPRPELQFAQPDTTIHRAFLETCDRMRNAVAMGDDMSVLTYRRCKLAAVILADAIRQEIKEDYVGIMLPASVGANLCIMATLLANKTPVMINWTLGDANLEHVMETSGVKRILSAGRFLDRLDQLNFDLVMDSLVLLEDLRAQRIRLGAKLRGWWRSHKSADALLKLFGSDYRKAADGAVILYTSGSESRPKGVPLSHRNILSDIHSAVPRVGLTADDTALGFLPPFHSFGFVVTGILPLTAGLKICYYPNPTESRKVAARIQRWQATLLCATPTFFAGLLKAAQSDQLTSLRLLVSGAEKAPDLLFRQAADLGITILEGYGITETGPVLTLNGAGEKHVGVGPAIDGVDLRIVDPESHQACQTGERGLILAAGPNIFDGYLHRDSSDVFLDLDGQRYYITGDLGYLDEDGFLTLSGRLKRFVKIGGEMISLPAMEDALGRGFASSDDDDGAHLAISAYEADGERPVLAAFADFDTDKDAVNQVLRDAGFSNLARVSMAIRVEEIPLLGTGKTDYQTLKRLLADELESR